MRKGTVALALMLAGSSALIGLVRAETPAAAPVDSNHKLVALADDMKDMKKEKRQVSDAEYMQHLRDARTKLSEAKDAFDADLPERGNRHDILQGIDKAIDAIDTQIKSMEDKMKK
jgi:hypothetical protein